MISKFAEEIYAKSIQLKKFNVNSLRFKSNRWALQNDLNEIHSLVGSILRCLYSETDYSIEYYELALFMDKMLFECIGFLIAKDKNCRKTVFRYLLGFHNLPRAFLPEGEPMKISPEEAMDYFRPYLKLD